VLPAISASTPAIKGLRIVPPFEVVQAAWQELELYEAPNAKRLSKFHGMFAPGLRRSEVEGGNTPPCRPRFYGSWSSAAGVGP
jgi:hypothetical protein